MSNQAKNKQNGKLDNFYRSQKVPMSIRALRFYFKKVGWMFPKRSAKLFWNLFTKPRKRTIKDWQQAFLNSAAKDGFSLDGHEYLTYTWGKGPKTVVLLHGWEGMAADYKNLIEALLQDETYKIVAFDFPAHGAAAGTNSSLVAFMKGMEHFLEQSDSIHAVIGHSLGASAAFFSLANLGKKVEHLLMLGSYPIPFHFFRTFQDFMEIPQPLFDKCVDYAEKLVGVNIRSYSMYEMRYKINADRVLMIHDTQDEVAHIEKAKALAAEWDRTEVFFGSHGGHFKHFRHPEVVARIVNQLKQHEPAGVAV